MYYNDEFPCSNPFDDRPNGYLIHGEYIVEDDEDDYDPDCSDCDDAPSSIVIDPRPSDDVDDVLPFLSLIRGVPRPRFAHPDLDNYDDDEYDSDDYPEDDEEEEEEYDPDDYAAYYNDDDYDLDDDSLTIASSPKAIPLDDYLY